MRVRMVAGVVLAVALVAALLAGMRPTPAPESAPTTPVTAVRSDLPAAAGSPAPVPAADEGTGEEGESTVMSFGRSVTEVTVRVVRAEDRGPIAGATVSWTMEGQAPRSAVTAADGTVRFEGFPANSFRVEAAAEGRVRRGADELQGCMGGDATYDEDGATLLSLARGVVLRGVVLAARDRSPVAGARVSSFVGGRLGRDYEVAGDDDRMGAAETDSEGRFAAAPVPPGKIVTLVVEHPAFLEADRALRPAEEPPHGGPLEFLLEDAASVVGTVTGIDGKPAGGVEVRAVPRSMFRRGEDEEDRALIRYPDGNRREDPLQRNAGGRALSGPDGRFAVGGLPPGTLHRVYAFRGEVERSSLVEATTPAAGNSTTADLRLESLTRVLVRVEGPDGATIREALVSLSPAAGPWPEDLEKRCRDERDTFEFDGVLPGEYVVTVRAEGLEEGVAPLRTGTGAGPVTVRLGAGVEIAGQVVHDSGEGVPGQEVLCYRLAGDGGDIDEIDYGEQYRHVKADEEGRYRVGGLRPGPYRLSIYGIDSKSVRADAPATDVALVRVRPAVAVARLVFPDGTSTTKRVSVDVTTRYENGGLRSGGAESEFDGRVLRVTDFPAGRNELRFEIPGFARVVRPFVGRPGETVDLGEIRLSVGVTVRGRVVDPEGKPVAGARVEPEWFGREPVRTDAEGRFRLEHMPEGSVVLQVRAEGWPELDVTVAASSGIPDHVVALVRGGAVRGSLRREGGGPLEGTVCFLAPGGSHGGVHPEAYAGEKGRFEIHLRPGSYVAQTLLHDEKPVSRDVEVVAGAETVLDIVIPAK